MVAVCIVTQSLPAFLREYTILWLVDGTWKIRSVFLLYSFSRPLRAARANVSRVASMYVSDGCWLSQ